LTVLTNKISAWRQRGLWTFLAVGAVIVLLMGLRMNALEYYGPARGLQDLFNALTLGSLYALIALGYTMVYGIIRLINFAHGEIFMLGAFLAFYAMLFTPAGWLLGVLVALFLAALVYGLLRPARGTSAAVKGGVAAAVFAFGALLLSLRGLGWLEATAVSMFLTAACGVFLYAIAYRPLWGAPRTSFLITAIAASFFLQNMGQLVFGPQVKGFRPETALTQPLTLSIAGETVYFSGILLFVPVLTGVLLMLLHAFVTRSKMGKAMRACAQDAEVAEMMGVNVGRIIAMTFFIGAMLAAVAGVFYALRFGQIHPLMGLLPGIKAFAAAVIGGIGSLPGAVLGGMLLGFIEVFVVALFPGLTAYRDVFAFVLLIVILIFRPSGLVGEDLTEKV
jgi:branched-chain amino acid transport system permease protein